MRGHKLFNASFVSKESTSSIVSSDTDASSDTTTGLNTFSGRVVIGLGDAVLQGVDHFIILRRLEVIKSAFPHDDKVAPENIGALYDDVLELSRINLYSERIREQALRILLIQINNRKTRYLIQHLVRWPSVEIVVFLSEIMACMPSEWCDILFRDCKHFTQNCLI
ncbi:hypothetical protein PILCRDRAFT_702827 [Piloderma croceum F 1598]|uniref:Uncharacterized protein n=1 Tax=Piloderma croceum (strain F 1598) TaxID=765440 RepID=A0A0C3AKN3_PILCF|nr:hypothetical protein PILCRDRAFT_702827 [Piloderma croceum F 1598]